MRKRRPSLQMMRLLAALAARPQDWRHGYDLMKVAGLHSGTLYPLLARMHDRGLIESQWHPPEREGRPPRHAYRLTAAGLALADANGRDAAATDGLTVSPA